MTYREMVIRAWGSEGDEKELGRRLFVLGDWLGNEGSRASQFPDAEPLQEIEDGENWEAEFQMDRPEEFDA